MYGEQEVLFHLRTPGVHVTLTDGLDRWQSMLKGLERNSFESPHTVKDIYRTYSLGVSGPANTSGNIHIWSWVAHYYWEIDGGVSLRKADLAIARINKSEYRFELVWGKEGLHATQFVLDPASAKILEKMFQTTRNYM